MQESGSDEEVIRMNGNNIFISNVENYEELPFSLSTLQ